MNYLTFFPLRQHRGSLAVASLLAVFVGLFAHGKPFVVDEPAAPKCLVDEIFLFPVRVDPELDTFLHNTLSFCRCEVFCF